MGGTEEEAREDRRPGDRRARRRADPPQPPGHGWEHEEAEEHLLVEPRPAESDEPREDSLQARLEKERPEAVLQPRHPHEHDGQEATLRRHSNEHPRIEAPAVVFDMLPGEQAEDREHREEEILAESNRIEEVPQPDVGAVTGGTSPQQQHAPFVREHERENEDEARQRHPRQRPVVVGGGRAGVVGSGRRWTFGSRAVEIGVDLAQQAVERRVGLRRRIAPVEFTVVTWSHRRHPEPPPRSPSNDRRPQRDCRGTRSISWRRAWPSVVAAPGRTGKGPAPRLPRSAAMLALLSTHASNAPRASAPHTLRVFSAYGAAPKPLA